MTIKELEQQLDIPRATIRFYEREGLVIPERKDNSYREYNEADVVVLKKIIILRKIGLSVSDIRKVLKEESSLQSFLKNHVSELENQIRELGGAISVAKIMQARGETISSLDENMYLAEIKKLEQSGLKFKKVWNDFIEFQKEVVIEEFLLKDKDGTYCFSLKEGIIWIVFECILSGLVFCLIEYISHYFGEEYGNQGQAFLEGFFWSFISIVVCTILGMPICLMGKKDAKLAKRINKVGFIIVPVVYVSVKMFLQKI